MPLEDTEAVDEELAGGAAASGGRVRLDGQVGLVTGASRGIGRAIAGALAGAGARVAVTARDPGSLDATLADLASLGAPGLGFGLDVRDVPGVRATVAAIEDRLGPVDILVNNAGIQRLRLALDLSEEDWDDVLDTNLRGAFFVAQAVGRGMVARRRGRIVNVASMAGLRGSAERSAYSPSKAALIMLTRILAIEWGPVGVRVNAVAPTFVETEMGRLTLDQPGRREAIVGMIPAGRLPSPAEVASAVLFLVSPAAELVNGVTLPVDGGFGAG